MDSWQVEEDDWFDEYLPGQDLPDGLQWTPFNVDLTTDREVTTYMYPGLRKGLKDVITTTGCEGLEALITHRVLEVDEDASWDEPSLEVSPELGIYPVSLSDSDILRPATMSPISADLSLARCAQVDVLVEVRRATAAPIGHLPTSFRPSSAMSCDTAVSASDDVPRFGFKPDGDEDPLEDSVIGVFNMQHRLFVFMILFVEDKARLLRFDRTAVSMTPEFNYAQRPEVIGKFLYRLSRNRAAVGHDPTATRADEADTALFRNLHTRYHPASAVGRGLRDAGIENWPVYKLCVEGRFSPDGSTAVLPNAPVSRREYLIGRPMRTWIDLAGRGTKTYVAYDVAKDQVVVIKDSWRPNSKGMRSEFDTYLLLYATDLRPDQPFCIPTLLGGGDVSWENAVQKTRTSHLPEPYTLIHFRLVLKEVCRPLEDFASSLELVRATLSALNGAFSASLYCERPAANTAVAFSAHSVAWVVADILHWDVSVGNILILDKNPEGPPNPKTSKGVLANWDFARKKGELESPTFTQGDIRSGTWQFMSARLQQSGPEQPRELSDDLESFVHVLNYCALKHLPNKLSNDADRVASYISRVYDHNRQSGGPEKGSLDKLDLLIENEPFVELRPRNQPLQHLLDALSELCYQHYHHIQFPPPQSPSNCPLEGTSVELPEDIDGFEELGEFLVSINATNPPAPLVLCTPPAVIAALPPPDPSKSPFKDHRAMGQQFLHVLRPPSSHPAYGLPWPVGDKFNRTKPVDLAPSASLSVSRRVQEPLFPHLLISR